MRVGILYNPISGKGKAQRCAEQMAAVLENAGHQPQLRESTQHIDSVGMREFLVSNEALIVAGGDGTLMPLLDLLAESETPVYMLPAGNESLFAKAFGSSKNPQQVLAALDRGTVSEHYYAHVGSKPFFHMLSLGFDSLVVRDVCQDRSGPVGNKGYVLPSIRRSIGYRPPLVSLSVDGNSVLQDSPGCLVIANHHTYAGMIAPVPEADSQQQCLHARFFPNMGLAGISSWGLAFVMGGKVNLEGSQLFSGRVLKVEVSSEASYPLQADGEYIGDAPQTVQISSGRITTYSTPS